MSMTAWLQGKNIKTWGSSLQAKYICFSNQILSTDCPQCKYLEVIKSDLCVQTSLTNPWVAIVTQVGVDIYIDYSSDFFPTEGSFLISLPTGAWSSYLIPKPFTNSSTNSAQCSFFSGFNFVVVCCPACYAADTPI